jgi:uncharacterized protein YehS (DUF1456 family)
MDEKNLAEIIRKVVKEELNAFKQEVVTKDDLKAFVTKEDLKTFATKDDFKAFATKEDLEKLKAEMATKEDLKAFATKDDIKKLKADVMTEIKAVRSEMVTRDDLRIYITKEDFDTFIKSISERLESFSERTLMLLKHYENDVRELHRRFDMIDFGLLLTHLDRLAGIMEKREQERILAENQLKRLYLEIKERVSKLEAIAGA